MTFDGVVGGPPWSAPMRGLFILIAIVYFLGVGIAIEPTIRGSWQSSTSVLYTNVVRALPNAFAWPATVVRSMMGGR
jgi:hypothetical protein